jgi:hypothetical protein
VQLAEIMAQDALGVWLPFALADLLRVQCVKPPKIEAIFRAWGLDCLAGQVEAAQRNRDVDDVLAAFRD